MESSTTCNPDHSSGEGLGFGCVDVCSGIYMSQHTQHMS